VLDQFWIVLGQVFTLVLLMGVGFILEKLGRLDGQGTAQMSTLLMYVVTPCLIIDAFQISCDATLLWTLGLGALALGGCYGVYTLLCPLFFRRTAPGLRDALRFSVIYGNVGFMGLPLVRSVLGEEAAIFAVLNIGIFNIFTWTHGIILMGGKEAFTPRKILLNPGVLGVLLGLPFLLTGTRLPASAGNAVEFLADLNTPLAMVVIGAQMGRADLANVLRQGSLYAAAGIKLILLPVVTALLLFPLRLDPVFTAVVVILSATPVSGSAAMFAERFSREPECIAQLVTLSTLLSVFTLPIVGALAQIMLL